MTKLNSDEKLAPQLRELGVTQVSISSYERVEGRYEDEHRYALGLQELLLFVRRLHREALGTAPPTERRRHMALVQARITSVFDGMELAGETV